MKSISSIALNTFRESIREKLLVIALFFGALLFGSSYILSPLALGAREKIVLDVGLAAVSLLGILITIMIGSTLLHKEVDRRAIYMVLTRPVSRLEYLIGKFWGILLAVGGVVAVMTAVMVLMLMLGKVALRPVIFMALYFTLLEIAVVCSIVVFFSTFTTPVLTSFFSVCLVVAGSLSGDLKVFAEKFGGTVTRSIADALYYVLPNLKVFNLRHEAVHGLPYRAGDLWLVTLYAAVYCGVVIYVAHLIFKRREFA
jgi:ABC-type transport system involved in multi-copper enzyme maturation permease subunit